MGNIYFDSYQNGLKGGQVFAETLLKARAQQQQQQDFLEKQRATELYHQQAQQIAQQRLLQQAAPAVEFDQRQNMLNPPAAMAVDTSAGDGVGDPGFYNNSPNASRAQYFQDNPIEKPGPEVPYSGGSHVMRYLNPPSKNIDPRSPEGIAADVDKKRQLSGLTPQHDDAATKKLRDTITGAGIPLNELMDAQNIWTEDDNGKTVDATLGTKVLAMTKDGQKKVWTPFFPKNGNGIPAGNTAGIVQAYNRLKARGAAPSGAPTGGDSIPTVSTPAEVAKLPSGTVFLTPDGRKKVAP